ncbi:MAG: condensation domain-containing protein, partial [Verrucomicrobiota bacterium]
NGKLDRQALPAPDWEAGKTVEYQPPESETEQRLAAIWCELLGLDKVSRQDNFFELGGHSFIALSLVAKLNELGSALTVRDVFSSPILSDMASSITTLERPSSIASPSLIPEGCPHITPEMLPLVSLTQIQIDQVATSLKPSSIYNIYPLSPLQNGFLLMHRLHQDQDYYILRTLLKFDSRSHWNKFATAFQRIIERHDILRTSFHWRGLPQPIQVVSRSAQIRTREIALKEGQDALTKLDIETNLNKIKINLNQAPLVNFVLSEDKGSKECFVAILNHHIIEDNYSLKILLRECFMIMEGREKELLPPVPYSDFISETLSSAHEKETFFQTRRLSQEGFKPLFGAGTFKRNKTIREAKCVLEKSLENQLRYISRISGTSPAVFLHAAWALAVGQQKDCKEFFIGTILSGRGQSGSSVDRAVGMFINLLPMKFNLNATAKEIIKETKLELNTLLKYEQCSLCEAKDVSCIKEHEIPFSTIINYRHNDLEDLSPNSAKGLQYKFGITQIKSDERTHFPLALFVDESSDCFEFCIQSATDECPSDFLASLLHSIDWILSALEKK